MPRKPCCKRVEELPGVTYFKPRAVALADLEEVTLSVEELEAMRLAHREGLYQLEASQRMGVSRATFGRLLVSAHRKITRALLDGCAVKIEGGTFRMAGLVQCEGCPSKTRSEMEDPSSPCATCLARPRT